MKKVSIAEQIKQEKDKETLKFILEAASTLVVEKENSEPICLKNRRGSNTFPLRDSITGKLINCEIINFDLFNHLDISKSECRSAIVNTYAGKNLWIKM